MASLWHTEPPFVGSPLGVSGLRMGYRQAISIVKLPAQQFVVYSFGHRLQSIVSVTGSLQGQL